MLENKPLDTILKLNEEEAKEVLALSNVDQICAKLYLLLNQVPKTIKDYIETKIVEKNKNVYPMVLANAVFSLDDAINYLEISAKQNKQ